MADNIFVPSVCKGEGARFQGTVSIREMTFDERLEFYESLGIDENESNSTKHYIRMLREIGKRSHSFVKCVELVRLSDQTKIQSWDEVYSNSELTSLVMEVCKEILGKAIAGLHGMIV